MSMKTYLACLFDSRKSFYNKAVVVDFEGGKLLESYNTPVAKVSEGKLELMSDWDYSKTTLRHVTEFAKQTNTYEQLLAFKKSTRSSR